MIHKLYYKPSINGNKSNLIEIMEGDTVKVDGKGDKLYKVIHLYNSDLRPLLFYRCGIRDLDTFMEGYDSIFGGELIFVDREFDDTDKKIHISDVISRFNFRDGDEETENKIIRYVELRGMLRTNTMGFINSKEFQDNYFEMEELQRWICRI